MEKIAGENRKNKSLLETTLNTRDLGGYKMAAGKYTKYFSLIRSDEIKSPNEHDINFLINNRIFTIIDMRGEKDVLSAPSPFEKMKYFEYYNIPIEEGSNIPESVLDVPYSYMRIAEAKNMPDVFRSICRANAGVLFHCSAGKDRTGVVSAILLLLAGVSEGDIVENYMLTKECNKERFKLITKKYPDLDINIVIPQEEYILTFLALFKSRYINAEQYLKFKGLNQKEISCIKRKMGILSFA